MWAQTAKHFIDILDKLILFWFFVSICYSLCFFSFLKKLVCAAGLHTACEPLGGPPHQVRVTCKHPSEVHPFLERGAQRGEWIFPALVAWSQELLNEPAVLLVSPSFFKVAVELSPPYCGPLDGAGPLGSDPQSSVTGSMRSAGSAILCVQRVSICFLGWFFLFISLFLPN